MTVSKSVMENRLFQPELEEYVDEPFLPLDNQPDLTAESIGLGQDQLEQQSSRRTPPNEIREGQTQRFLRMHTSMLLLLAVVSSVTGLFIFVLFAYGASIDTRSQQPVLDQPIEKMTAVLLNATGPVERMRSGGTWEVIGKEGELVSGDTLRAGPETRASVLFGDGSIVRLDQSAEVTVDSLARERIALGVTRGAVYVRVTKRPERLFRVAAGDSNFDATGTAFKVSANQQIVGVEVYQGAVAVAGVSVEQGSNYYVSHPDTSQQNQVLAINIEGLKVDAFVQWCKSQDEKDPIFKRQLGFLADFVPPVLVVDSPLDNQKVTMPAGSTQGLVDIIGATEAGTKVSIGKTGESEFEAVRVDVGEDGRFSALGLLGSLGAVSYRVIAVDASGNKTIKDVPLLFDVAEPVADPAAEPPLNIQALVEKDGGFRLSWQVKPGVDVSGGFKIIWSVNKEPTLESGSSAYVGADSRTYQVDAGKIQADKTYYVRVCLFISNSCSAQNYSKQQEVVIPAR